MLYDAVVLLGRFDAFARSLEEIMAQRLLDIDVLPLTRPDRDQRMPVVARRDRDRIQILAVDSPRECPAGTPARSRSSRTFFVRDSYNRLSGSIR